MASTEPFELSIVIPVYRSEKILPRLVTEVKAAMDAAALERFELILVNDCSPDASWATVEQLARDHGFVRGINLRKNVGQHNAIMAGLNHATGTVIVVMDDDLQHSPAYIAPMREMIRSGYDVCYTRYLHRKHPLWKRIGSDLNDAAANVLLKKPRGIYLSSFKAMSRAIRDEVIKYRGPYAYVDGLILLTTNSIGSIDIEHQARLEGEGNYNLTKSISLWLKMATSFSILPLRIASYLGFAFSAASMLLAVLIAINKLLDPTVEAGWTSIIAAVLFIGGIQLLALGLIGEYVGRTYLNINQRPQYTIKNKTW